MQRGHYREEELQFLRKHAKDYGLEYCAKELNRSVEGLIHKCYREKIDFLVKSTTKPVEKFFCKYKELDLNFQSQKYPKELAYFLGYFWADGYIDNKGCIKLQIVKSDALDIKSILEKIGTFSIFTKKALGRKETIIFYLNSQEKAKVLRSLGKYPHTSESHKKILDYIPKEYHIYFLRGLFDGDGSIYGNKNCIWFSIYSNVNQDWTGLQDCLSDYDFNVRVVKSTHHNKSGKISNFSFIRNTSRKDTSNFISKLYCIRDNIWLQRKYDKCLQLGLMNDEETKAKIPDYAWEGKTIRFREDFEGYK